MPAKPAEIDPTLATVVRRIRKERGLSMEALAFNSSITLNTVSRLENSKSEPGWMTVRKIAESLGLTLAELGAAIDAESNT